MKLKEAKRIKDRAKYLRIPVTICVYFNSMIVNTFLTDLGTRRTHFFHCLTLCPPLPNYHLPPIFTRYHFTIEGTAKLLRLSSLSRLSLFVTVVIVSL